MDGRKCHDSASFTGTQGPKGMGGDGRDEKPHRGQAPKREVFQELHFLFSLPSYSALSPSHSVSKQKSGQNKVVIIEK